MRVGAAVAPDAASSIEPAGACLFEPAGRETPRIAMSDSEDCDSEDSDSTYYPPIMQAATDGDFRRVKQLIQQGVDIDETDDDQDPGSTALGAAAAHGHVDVVNLLLENGADVDHADESRCPSAVGRS